MLIHHLEKLVHFVGVVRAGSIRRYAIGNGLSQPAISKCIQILEADLECSLLIRSRGGLTLTQPGLKLFEFAERALSEAGQTDGDIRTRGRSRLKGDLMLGAYSSIAVYFVPELLRFLMAEQAGLKIGVFTAASADLVRGLRQGKLDFIISVDPPRSADLVVRSLYSDAYSLYQPWTEARAAHSSAIFTVPTAADSKGRKLQSYLKSAGLLERMHYCSDFETVKSMVERGVGLGLMPDRVAQVLVQAGRAQLSQSETRLHGIARHEVALSFRRHRQGDAALLWVARQVEVMMGGPARKPRPLRQ